MTVNYSNSIATATSMGLLKLLLRWRGSVYKLLWKELLLFLAIYYTLHMAHTLALDEDQQIYFEDVVRYSKKFQDMIPISFVLGFFVSSVMIRWWSQYQTIPWPSAVAYYVSATLHGADEVSRAMRRTIMRYMCLSITMVFRSLSPRVQKRFPKMQDLIEAGMINEAELAILNTLDNKYRGYSKYWLPIVWAASIVTKARNDGRISDDFAMKTIHEEMDKFRSRCAVLMQYSNIPVPLVYTQVVTMAVYTYFLAALMGQQPLPEDKTKYGILGYVPVFSLLQFFFYMGWLKVAETMINPFGEDDDDFDVNSIIDKNLQMVYLIVDEMHNEYPELVKDQYWDEMPEALPDKGKKYSDDARAAVKRRAEDTKVLGPSDFIDYEVEVKQSVWSTITQPKVTKRSSSESLKHVQSIVMEKVVHYDENDSMKPKSSSSLRHS